MHNSLVHLLLMVHPCHPQGWAELQTCDSPAVLHLIFVDACIVHGADCLKPSFPNPHALTCFLDGRVVSSCLWLLFQDETLMG